MLQYWHYIVFFPPLVSFLSQDVPALPACVLSFHDQVYDNRPVSLYKLTLCLIFLLFSHCFFIFLPSCCFLFVFTWRTVIRVWSVNCHQVWFPPHLDKMCVCVRERYGRNVPSVQIVTDLWFCSVFYFSLFPILPLFVITAHSRYNTTCKFTHTHTHTRLLHIRISFWHGQMPPSRPSVVTLSVLTFRPQ